MTSHTVVLHGIPVLVPAPDGPPLRTGDDAVDLIGAALGHGVDAVAIPVGRLDDTFFTLRTGVAGEIAQKFANYRLRLAIVGDISAHLARSPALRDFVAETNRGTQLWFVDSVEDLERRFTP